MKLYCMLGEDQECYTFVSAWALDIRGVEEHIMHRNKVYMADRDRYYLPYVVEIENDTLQKSHFIENIPPITYGTASLIYKDNIELIALRKQQYEALGLSKNVIDYFKEG